jgi:energy-converting hydrogenase A subunit M
VYLCIGTTDFRKMSVHANVQVNEDVDLVENMLKETGCVELHHKVQARSFSCLNNVMLVQFTGVCVVPAVIENFRTCRAV